MFQRNNPAYAIWRNFLINKLLHNTLRSEYNCLHSIIRICNIFFVTHRKKICQNLRVTQFTISKHGTSRLYRFYYLLRAKKCYYLIYVKSKHTVGPKIIPQICLNHGAKLCTLKFKAYFTYCMPVQTEWCYYKVP